MTRYRSRHGLICVFVLNSKLQHAKRDDVVVLPSGLQVKYSPMPFLAVNYKMITPCGCCVFTFVIILFFTFWSLSPHTQYRVITPGRPDGERPTESSDCVVEYEGKLADTGKIENEIMALVAAPHGKRKKDCTVSQARYLIAVSKEASRPRLSLRKVTEKFKLLKTMFRLLLPLFICLSCGNSRQGIQGGSAPDEGRCEVGDCLSARYAPINAMHSPSCAAHMHSVCIVMILGCQS